MDENMDDKNDEVQIKASGLSTSFTISFEDGTEKTSVIKQKRIIKTANTFTKKHYRTLSLPVANNTFFSKSDAVKYDGCDSETQETTVCKKNSLKDIPQIKEKPNHSAGAVTTPGYKGTCRNSFEAKSNNNSVCIIDNEQPTTNLSDTDSEGGTYTIDKNNEQVKEARKSIDQVFGISSENQNDENITSEKKLEKRTRMVDEWIVQNVSILKTDSNGVPKTTPVNKSDNIKTARTSKIPFPIERSREPSSTNLSNGVKYQTAPVNGTVQNAISESKIKQLSSKNLSNCEEIDTECYLRETENIVCALQKKMIRNDMKPQLRLEEPKIQLKDQNGKESAPSKYSLTRFNRAFSLRRDRSKKPTPVVATTSTPVRSKTFVGTLVKTIESASPKTGMRPNSSLCKDYLKSDTSLKLRSTPRSKTSSSDFGRKPSAKSTQEIELHNWKRRKNYDPMKAVAEEKKRKALAGTASNSVSSAHLQQTSNNLEEPDDLAAKIIIRSASFHGLRNKNGFEMESTDETALDRTSSNRSVCSYFISSNEDATEYDNDSEDHWVIPKPPSTSLQNTPPESISSRLSLLSNAASNSSVLLLTSSTVTNVDSVTVSKVTQMSYKIKDTILALTNSINEIVENTVQYSKDQGGLVSSSRTLHNRDNGEIVDNLCSQTEDDLSLVENDISADYQLNIALNNLNEVYQAVQKLNIKCAK